MSFDKVKNKNIKKNIFFISCNMSVEEKIIKKLKILIKKFYFFNIPLSKNYFFKKKLRMRIKKQNSEVYYCTGNLAFFNKNLKTF